MNRNFKVSGLLFIIIFIAAQLSFAQGFKYDSKGRRDPFASLVNPKDGAFMTTLVDIGKVEEIKLEGIILDAKNGDMAIINDALLKQGERIGGFEILKIEREKVILRRSDKEYVINLIPELEEMEDVKEIKNIGPDSD